MAKTNKYASLNFNDLYENKISKSNPNRPSSSSSSSSTTTKTVITNSRIHGNMLVLTRPSPKPIAHPPQPPPVRPSIEPDDSIEPDSISLRPLGRTGRPPSSLLLKVNAGSVSPKSNKFVPPHLRPGFRGKEEKPDPEVKKQLSFRQNPRPKSGGGYDRDSMNRPRSSGANRPVSSG